MSNEQSNVVTKVIDFRHKAPDQAIHELMQAAKDGYAVTKITTRFNHTHVYLETSAKQVSTSKAVDEPKQVAAAANTEVVNEGVDSKVFSETVDKLVEKELLGKDVAEKAKSSTTKKTTTKTTVKKVEPKDGE